MIGSTLPDSLPVRIWNSWRHYGFLFVIRYSLARIFAVPIAAFLKRSGPPDRFSLQGRPFRYFLHAHNTTWMNERIVEIPIVWEAVRNCESHRILEVGNVLSHYFPIQHDVLDKYEHTRGTLNEDVESFRPVQPYELIVSISTMEHVGFDERPQDPEKIRRALANIKDHCLATGGKLLFTVPLGYNPFLDRFLDQEALGLSRRYCLKRISADNRWVEADWAEVRDSRYGSPFYFANGLVVGIIEKS